MMSGDRYGTFTNQELEQENQRLMRARGELRGLLDAGDIDVEEFKRLRDGIRAAQRRIAEVLQGRAELLREAMLAAHGLLPGVKGDAQVISADSIESEEGFGRV